MFDIYLKDAGAWRFYRTAATAEEAVHNAAALARADFESRIVPAAGHAAPRGNTTH